MTANLERLLKDPAVSENKKKELALYQYIADQNVPAVAYPSGYQTIWVEMFARYYEQISFGQTSVDDAVDAFIAEAEGEL